MSKKLNYTQCFFVYNGGFFVFCTVAAQRHWFALKPACWLESSQIPKTYMFDGSF